MDIRASLQGPITCLLAKFLKFLQLYSLLLLIPVGGATDDERIAFIEYLAAAVDAPIMLIDSSNPV